ncbi:MAG: hypothetical protein OEV08_04160 [Nitrospira sp.]|nr:hypothetical protein [Nitrospira sp.]
MIGETMALSREGACMRRRSDAHVRQITIICACAALLLGQLFNAEILWSEPTPTTDKCSPSMGNAPIDIYIGTDKSPGTFLQKQEGMFGFSNQAVRLLDFRATLHIIFLCNHTFAAVWEPLSYKEAKPLEGRILDRDGKSISADFLIAENEEVQSQHSVARLYNDGFVVAWSAFTQNGTQIKVRVFDSSGHPTTQSFPVSESGTRNVQPVTEGLPNGTFITTWMDLDQQSLFFRLFQRNGKPLTNEIEITSFRQWSRWPNTLLKAHEDNSFTIFLIDPSGTYDAPIEPIPAARQYNQASQPMTPLRKGQEVKTMDGYQDIIERLAGDAMTSLDYSLRTFSEKDVMGFRFCSKESTAETLMANRMKMYSTDSRKQDFFTHFCKMRLTHCGHIETRPQEHVQCMQSGAPTREITTP